MALEYRDSILLEEEFLKSDRCLPILERLVAERTLALTTVIDSLEAELTQHVGLAVQLSELVEQSRQAAILEERNRLAREIHDTLAQAFTGMVIQLGVAQRISRQQPEEAWGLVDRVAELARQGLAEARRSVWSLQPDAEKYQDLARILPYTVGQMTAAATFRTDIRIIGTPYLLPPEVGLNLLRIGQEAINNVLRHAQAKQVSMVMTFDTMQVQLSVQDDGKGFDPNHLEDSGGFGLIGMRQRAERINGHLTILTQPGRGTKVTIIVSVVSTAAEDDGRITDVEYGR